MTQGYFCVRLRIFRVSVKSRQTRYLWNQRSSEIPTLCGGFFYSFCNDHSRRNSTQPCFSQPEDPPPASIATCLQKIFADLRISPVSMLSKNNSLWEVNTLRSQSWTWKKKIKTVHSWFYHHITIPCTSHSDKIFSVLPYMTFKIFF